MQNFPEKYWLGVYFRCYNDSNKIWLANNFLDHGGTENEQEISSVFLGKRCHCHIQRLIWTGWIKVHEARSKCRINLHALPLRTKMQISQRMILFLSDSRYGGTLRRRSSIHFWKAMIFPARPLFCLQLPEEADSEKPLTIWNAVFLTVRLLKRENCWMADRLFLNCSSG